MNIELLFIPLPLSLIHFKTCSFGYYFRIKKIEIVGTVYIYIYIYIIEKIKIVIISY